MMHVAIRMTWTFVESSEFTRRVVERELEEPLRRLQQLLPISPTVGPREPGACGLRKVRIPDPRRGTGKRSGVRVRYLVVPQLSRIYLLNL